MALYQVSYLYLYLLPLHEVSLFQYSKTQWKKRPERRKHCVLAIVRRSQKISHRSRPLPGGVVRPKLNQLEMVTTFTYKPSLVRIDTVRENVCNNSKKRKKSCFLDFEKRKKNVKKRTYSFTGHLITQPLILNYRKSVPVSPSFSRLTCWRALRGFPWSYHC